MIVILKVMTWIVIKILIQIKLILQARILILQPDSISTVMIFLILDLVLSNNHKFLASNYRNKLARMLPL